MMNHVDSEKDEKWKRFLQFLCLFDEFASEMYVENIRAAHIGKLLNRMVFGTLPLGYEGVEIPGSSNRKGKPIRRIEIHEKSAQTVRDIFDWFANQAMSIHAIIRKLNSNPTGPRPPKSKSGEWTRLAVKSLLRNDRYRGEWSYGKTESIPITKMDYIRQDERAVPLKTVHFEELRLISDELFFKTQKLLAELDESANRGRKASAGGSERIPKILNNFFICPKHDQRLHVGGPRGEYMICPSCRRYKSEDRFLFSQLNREIALQQLCSKLCELIQNDSELVEQIILHCQAEADRLQKPDAGQLEKLRHRKQKLKRSMGLLLRQEPDSSAEEQELESAIREKKIELSQVELDLTRLESANGKEVVIPSAEDVKRLLQDVSQQLADVADNGAPEEIDQLRELIRRLTGGRIELYQQGERRAQQGWLQGRFRAPILSVLSNQASGIDSEEGTYHIDVVVDFKAPDRDAELLETAWELYQEGMLNKEIAETLGCSRGNVTRLLKKAAEMKEVDLEDGRKRRSRLNDKQMEPPQYKLIDDEAVALWNQDASYLEIGRKLNCSDATAKKMIRFWHESRGLPVPTVASRREERRVQAQQLRDTGLSDAEIARRLNVSSTTIRNLLS